MIKSPLDFSGAEEPRKISFETRDTWETAKARLEKLKPFLKTQAEKLRKMGAPVDDEARIDMSLFSKIGKYDQKMIDADSAQVKQREELHGTEIDPMKTLAKSMGELLEVTKTLLFNQHWFKRNFLALRTSKFDDYVLGIDELLFDTVTFKPLAVIDTTTAVKDVEAKITRGGKIKYGLKWEKKGFVPSALENLPVFVVQIKNEDVLRLARELLEGAKFGEVSQKLEKSVLERLRLQCEEYGTSHPNKISAEAYTDASEVFKLILQNYK